MARLWAWRRPRCGRVPEILAGGSNAGGIKFGFVYNNVKVIINGIEKSKTILFSPGARDADVLGPGAQGFRAGRIRYCAEACCAAMSGRRFGL